MADVLSAKKLAMRYIAARMYTSREIYDRLRRRGVDGETAELAVSELIREGALNDKYYAECYISDSINLNAKGEYRIRQELMRKGIARTVIDCAFEESDADTEEALRRLVEERLRITEINDRRDLEKLRAYLARRGYSVGEIRRALDEYDFDFRD